MRKSYRFLQTLMRPEKIIFLGDMMDGGREWADDQWMQEFQRYQSIFTNRYPRQTQIYNIAGNHDIGIGNTVIDHALQRFHRYVGPTNIVLDIADHQVILLDTLLLENDDRNKSRDSRDLVSRIAKNASDQRPRLLFTHVPMWRPSKTYCGVERQSKEKYLLERTGYQFRDQLFQNTTSYLLEKIRPNAVFSGDDHDSCTVDHEIPNAPGILAREYTVGAFGWASGVPVASYALLTLYPRTETREAAFLVQRCFLPYQLGIYKMYLLSFAVSLAIIGVFCFKGSQMWLPVAMDHEGAQWAVIGDMDRLVEHGMGANGRWMLSKRGFVRHFALILGDVLAAGVPTYIACVLFSFIF
ncbi:hypothetical protein J3B02_001983 [Coemansia erecta]|nr:hypothetical protein J3B02_001983 [Coemansia erecta]